MDTGPANDVKNARRFRLAVQPAFTSAGVGFEKKLANQSFLSKAPQSVVDGEREKLSSARAILTRLKKAHERVLATR